VRERSERTGTCIHGKVNRRDDPLERGVFDYDP
jgi:hypothetical protein